jgi:hypothetical protein
MDECLSACLPVGQAGWPLLSVVVAWDSKRTCQTNNLPFGCTIATTPSCQIPFCAHHCEPAGSPWF